MPTPGDQLAPALAQAGKLLGTAHARTPHVMVLTDGFNDPSTAFAAAAKLRASGAQVDVVGIGTREGAPVSHAAGGFDQHARGHRKGVGEGTRGYVRVNPGGARIIN